MITLRQKMASKRVWMGQGSSTRLMLPEGRPSRAPRASPAPIPSRSPRPAQKIAALHPVVHIVDRFDGIHGFLGASQNVGVQIEAGCGLRVACRGQSGDGDAVWLLASGAGGTPNAIDLLPRPAGREKVSFKMPKCSPSRKKEVLLTTTKSQIEKLSGLSAVAAGKRPPPVRASFGPHLPAGLDQQMPWPGGFVLSIPSRPVSSGGRHRACSG